MDEQNDGKKPKRLTKFNADWLKKYSWVKKHSEHEAFCTKCKLPFKIGIKGEGNLKDHANSKGHKRASAGVQAYFCKYLITLYDLCKTSAKCQAIYAFETYFCVAPTTSQSNVGTSSQSEAASLNQSASVLFTNESRDANQMECDEIQTEKETNEMETEQIDTENIDESCDIATIESTSAVHGEGSVKDIPETHDEDPIKAANLDTNEDIHIYDLGLWMNKRVTTEQKKDLLKRYWVPPETYDFSADSKDPERKFIHSWLETYKPWLVYSKKLKGALCLYCVLFHQNVVQGVLGGFVVHAYTKFKNMHDACKNHAVSSWHQASMKAAIDFSTFVPVDVQMITAHKKLIEENKKIIRSIISNIIFCGITDSPLRGKDANSGKIFRI